MDPRKWSRPRCALFGRGSFGRLGHFHWRSNVGRQGGRPDVRSEGLAECRVEMVAQGPEFDESWCHRRRCLVREPTMRVPRIAVGDPVKIPSLAAMCALGPHRGATYLELPHDEHVAVHKPLPGDRSITQPSIAWSARCWSLHARQHRRCRRPPPRRQLRLAMSLRIWRLRARTSRHGRSLPMRRPQLPLARRAKGRGRRTPSASRRPPRCHMPSVSRARFCLRSSKSKGLEGLSGAASMKCARPISSCGRRTDEVCVLLLISACHPRAGAMSMSGHRPARTT